MNTEAQIEAFIASLPEPKRQDMTTLHQLILNLSPQSKLWFLDGKDSQNKVVSNPNIGYGSQITKYANGSIKENFQLSISPNTTGISLYILGISDKTYLSKLCADKLGKASITGYCIKFKSVKDINLEVLTSAIQYGFSIT
jgi:hypothetical protein